MRKRLRILFAITSSLMMMFTCCKSHRSEMEELEPLVDFFENSENEAGELKAIYYHMSLPVEMARLFQLVGANYYPDLLNPVDKLTDYTTPVVMATNLGIYGVDLSYAKMYDQTVETLDYMNAIQSLSDELGIPREVYSDVLENLEKYIANSDSLMKAANEIYNSADRYLKQNQRESAAALVIMGGWIESMYIASSIFISDQTNIELMEKIAEQKYSLNSLISLLNNYYTDENVNQYLLVLKSLKRSFDKFEIYYKKGDLAVDTVSKMISASRYHINITPDHIVEIHSKVSKLRQKIVE